MKLLFFIFILFSFDSIVVLVSTVFRIFGVLSHNNPRLDLLPEHPLVVLRLLVVEYLLNHLLMPLRGEPLTRKIEDVGKSQCDGYPVSQDITEGDQSAWKLRVGKIHEVLLSEFQGLSANLVEEKANLCVFHQG